LGALAQGFWLSFVVGVLSAYWIAFAAQEFLQVSRPVSAAVLLLFSATCAQPHLLIIAPLLYWSHRRFLADAPTSRSMLVCFALALLYAGLDAVTPRLFDVGLGYALHASSRLRQAADLGGVPLLTFVIALANLLLWRALVLVRSRTGRATAVAHLVVVGVTLVALAAYGSVRNRESRALVENAGAKLEVGVVQGNVANDVRLRWARGDERAAEEQLAAYTLPTEELARRGEQPELIVWPEATFPGVFMQPRSTLQRGRANKFDRQLLRLNRPVVFGAYDLESNGPQPTVYNALFAVTPRYDAPGAQGTVQRYRKHLLLPFAETIPGMTKNAWLRQNLPSLGFFDAGDGPRVLEIETPSRNKVNLGPIICSESLSSRHVLQTVQQGAEVLVNIGSDGWFGKWGEPQFHLAVARMRSVESRRPQIRAANTGISALILPGGEIVARSAVGSKATLRFSVPLVSPVESTAVRWGDWFGWISLLFGISTILLISLHARASSGEPQT
jgi:apolipoprotein N-acyltransferase